MRQGWTGIALASMVLVRALGCSADDPEIGLRQGGLATVQSGFEVPAPLPAAHCQVLVEGVGMLDLETEYLPNVVRCENNGANLEALKAQAVAARSVAYYAMETDGAICDSQGCQVFSCGGVADPIHYQAVAETSGLYLTYNATLTYGFYVAGDSAVQGPGCIGAAGATEQWVTYNEGRTSTDVEQTALGFVHAPGDVGYGQNRGCMGQWSARCLENENAYDYRAILRFFYGDDVEVIQAPGACVDENVDASGDSSGMTTAADGTSADLDGGSDSATSGLETSAGTSAGTSGMGTRGPGEADDGEPESGGTGASSAALPGTYGVNESDQAGCACQSRPGGTSWLLGLLAVFIGGPRVPRTKKPRAPERIG